MKLFLTLLILLNFVSCNKQEASEEKSPTEDVVIDPTSEIVALMQGNYSSCRASTLYGGYYNKVVINVSGTSMHVEYELSASATCATRYYRHTLEYEIVKADYKTAGDSENILVDVKNKSFKLQWNFAWYVSQNYCGFNDWVINVDKDLTGVPCAGLLATYDPHHSSYPALDQMIYLEMQIKTTGLVYPIGTTTSGDTADDRLNTHMFESATVP